jgi:hypothetical protein
VEPVDSSLELEQSMLAALDGSREAAFSFYQLLSTAKLHVFERNQAQLLSHQPQYPNTMMNVLAMQTEEHVIVPVFTSEAHAKEWCDLDLKRRLLSVAELRQIIPTDWWLCVNPGQEVEKEISPWELEQLRDGKNGISAILEELFAQFKADSLNLRALKEGEYTGLRRALNEFAKDSGDIQEIYALVDEGRSADDLPVNTVLLGVVMSPRASRNQEFSSLLQAAAKQAMIGSDEVKIFSADSRDNFKLALFQKTEPFFRSTAKGGGWRGIRSRLIRHLARPWLKLADKTRH